MVPSLPESGKWITYRIGDHEFTCQVGDYEHHRTETIDSAGSHQYFDTCVTVKHMDGSEDTMTLEELSRYSWSYVEVPSQETLQAAATQGSNIQREIECAFCKSNTRKLRACNSCKKSYYCDQECQKNDWKTHKKDCFYDKIKRKPDPRYPLARISNDFRTRQRVMQSEFHNILLDGLYGRFETMHIQGSFFLPPSTSPDIGRWVRNPNPADLEPLERYQIQHDSPRTDNQESVIFKWRGLESRGHGNGEPIACSLIGIMECLLLDDQRYREGGLHYLAGGLESPGVFWAMIMNFNTFGTVAPFHANCNCSISKLPKKQKKLISKWDMIFKRAKEDEFDVQCMFSDTPVGCHNFGECPFKHEVECSVKVDKK
uniref:MYND-type domain-containing protein n=1 Tax=Clytia hemisphaerica TaxID=252671 RepID=A0A7M5XIV9_9CNID|eukprot:TCONS_00012138-protein